MSDYTDGVLRFPVDFPPNTPHVEVSLVPAIPATGALYLVGWYCENVIVSASDPAHTNAPTTCGAIKVSITPSVHMPPVINAIPLFNADTGAAVNNPKTGAAYFAAVNMGTDSTNNVAVNVTGMPASTGISNSILIFPGVTTMQGEYKELDNPLLVCGKLPDSISRLVFKADDFYGRAITFDRLILMLVVRPERRALVDTSRTPLLRSAAGAFFN